MIFSQIERCQACEKDEVPQPEYTINLGDIMIQFTEPEDRIVHTFSSKGTVTEQQLLNLLLEDPGYTYQELASKLNVGRRTVYNRMKTLKEKGIIERIGSDKKGYWKINDYQAGGSHLPT